MDKPTLTAETLEAFWMEDVSDGDYVEAAASFFMSPIRTIKKVMQEITV